MREFTAKQNKWLFCHRVYDASKAKSQTGFGQAEFPIACINTSY